jgi:hypothetical protein
MPCFLQIGIQIRVGDWQLVNSSRYVIHPQNHPWLFQHFFDCADEIQEEAFYIATVSEQLAETNAEAPRPLRAVW